MQHPRRAVLEGALLVGARVVTITPSAPTSALVTYAVNSTLDVPRDGTPGVCSTPSGVCTLRAVTGHDLSR